MGDEKETVKKLLESARIEFMEKGFMKASLRNICKNAGVTTGALYFFFKNKDELFTSLVKQPLEQVSNIMISHYEQESFEMEKALMGKNMDTDLRAAYEITHKLYQHRESFILLLSKSQGSSMESALDELIALSDQNYRKLADGFSKAYGTSRVDDDFIHWLSHMLVDVFVYMITHIETEEEASKYINHAVSYMLKGWYGIFEGM